MKSPEESFHDEYYSDEEFLDEDLLYYEEKMSAQKQRPQGNLYGRLHQPNEQRYRSKLGE
jgi:hypothetical protein